MLGRFGLPRTIVTGTPTLFTTARFRRYCELMLGRNVRHDSTCIHVRRYLNMSRELRQLQISFADLTIYFGGKRKINFTVGKKIIVKRHYQNGNKYVAKRDSCEEFRNTNVGAYEHYNSDESDNNYTFVKMQSKADDRARQTRIKTITTQGADCADEMQSAEGYSEEMNTLKNDSTMTSSSLEGGGEGGDITAHGDESGVENKDANSSDSDPEWTPPPH
ncbi:hypothetical protein EVAR_90983_1 [Eumeta japonica]|uniref:Uncharacterized protein n=1 Tax=Eumeta variegata TaxID=151549 RepID=A0A4C1Z1X6_EUMVA|nr:hypothetical protein EVAR_90983_1 [Eumeta japonica]